MKISTRTNFMCRVLCLSLTGLMACSGALSPKEYAAFIGNPGNGLAQQAKSGAYTFKATYQPPELLTLIQMKGELPTRAMFEERKKDFSSLKYFSFSVFEEKGRELINLFSGDSIQSQKATRYFSFDMAHDVYLLLGKDTIRNVLFNYNRSYGLTPENNFSIAFDVSGEWKDDFDLLFQDRFLGCGLTRFHFRRTDIDNLPQLALSQEK